MPDDRLLHRCAGHGERANQLTHLEYRVWTQYILSSDDFGVMRRTALTIQADNDALADERPAVIERALLRLVAVALVVEFEHQRRYYICQLDWQFRQKIDYPRGTSNPKPPDSIIAKCDELTRRLFDGHPGGKGRKKPDSLPSGSSSVLRTESEPKENIRDYAGASAREEANANANANGSDKRLTANGSEEENTSDVRARECDLGNLEKHPILATILAVVRGIAASDRVEARQFHRAVERGLKAVGLPIQREVQINDRGPGREGFVDLVVTSNPTVGIELDWRTPRGRSLSKLAMFDGLKVIVLRESHALLPDIAGLDLVIGCPELSERAGRRPTTGSGVMAGMLPRDHLRHAFCGRVCLPSRLHVDFLRAIGGDPETAAERVRAFCEAVDAAWSNGGPQAMTAIGDDAFAFWRARWAEQHGTTAKTAAEKKREREDAIWAQS